jgi:hypothetical protein
VCLAAASSGSIQEEGKGGLLQDAELGRGLHQSSLMIEARLELVGRGMLFMFGSEGARCLSLRSLFGYR